ncbi:DMT family transporter [Marinobacterium arenosum]|uniref:DMT family transporter n=1 Tax=Marinobacterium arenosum TaxID=2862496 RepID=UPI001C97685B|nr:DMT family transporter [Marinobacterium arenosum]MBY4678838.1 DMT family transporter [Marinobacterium arenosum]
MVVDRQQLVPLVPWAFVVLWSTGFIGAKYAVPHMEPFSVLLTRMLLTLLVFASLLWWRRPQWPNRVQAGHQLVVGLLVHAGYLGAVFSAIHWQMPAGVTAIIMGLQPLLTALIGWLWLRERLNGVQWLGLLLGLAGVLLVVSQTRADGAAGAGAEAWIAALVALLSISIGTLYQKRFGGGVDLLVGAFYQYLSTALAMALLAWWFDSGQVQWTAELILSLAWLVLGLSVAGILLLLFMIREGEASRVASYFYLVPPQAALEAWLLFDEILNALALAGILLSVAGVYLTVRRRS